MKTTLNVTAGILLAAVLIKGGEYYTVDSEIRPVKARTHDLLCKGRQTRLFSADEVHGVHTELYEGKPLKFWVTTKESFYWHECKLFSRY